MVLFGRRLRYFFRIEFAPVLPRWTRLTDDESSTGRVRRLVPVLLVESAPSRSGRALSALTAIWWPVRATVEAVVCVLRYGGYVRSVSGVGRGRQLGEVLTLAHRLNYSPRTYYLYRFWSPEITDEPSTFAQINEMSVCQMVLTDDYANMSMLGDKERFGEACAVEGIPTPTIIGSFGPADSADRSGEPQTLPREDLFMKHAWGKAGQGAERWVYDADSDTWSRRGISLSEAALFEHLRHSGRWHRVLVQGCLVNHHELTRFSSGPICTFRVMSYLDETDTPQPLALTFKMPRGDSDVDNLDAGGLAAGVVRETGRIGPAFPVDRGTPPFRRHPDNDEPIDGAVLTFCDEIVEIALRAHERLDVPWWVGWDVAMTPDGPIVLEGNPHGDIDFFHIHHGRGLPDDFARLLLDQLQQARDARPTPP